MPAEKIEQEALSGLSAEEQAALAEDTGEQAELDAIIGDEEDEEEAATGEEGDNSALSAEEQAALDEEETDANAETSAETPAAEVSNEAAAEQEAAEVEEDKPTYNYMLPVDYVEDFDKKLEGIKADKLALREKLDAGDIDMAAYEDEREALNDKAYDLKTQQTTATNNAKANEQAGKQRWEVEQEVFFSAEANTIYADKYIGAAFNQAVIDLANDPKNTNWSGPKFLAEADKIIRKTFNLGAPAAAEKETTPAVKPAPRKPDLKAVPKSLANLPNAETETSKGGEFAHLDGLDGMDLENAIAKLSKDQLDRYAAA